MEDNTKNDIAKTIEEGKNLAQLVKNYSKMEIVDKGSSILSTVILIIIIIAIGTIAIFCLCMAFYHWLKSKTNDPILSFSIIAIFLLFLCTLIILFKKTLIESPIIKMINKALSGSEDLGNIPMVKTKNDVVRQKSSLILDIKKSGTQLKDEAKESFSLKHKTSNGSKFDFNKLATYAIFLYKGIVWTNKVRRFIGGNKGKKYTKKKK